MAVALAAGSWGGTLWLRGHPDRAEAWLAEGWHPWMLQRLGDLSGLSPLPVAEGLVAVVALWLLSLPFQLRGVRRDPLRAWTIALMRMGRLAALAVLLAQGLWGVHYARPGLEDRLGLPTQGSVSPETLLSLTEGLIEATNAQYLALHGTEDLGDPSPAPTMLDREALGRAWERAIARWGLPEAMAYGYPSPRALRLTPIFRKLGFHGVFVPWTGEGLVMRDLVGPAFAYTALHESAHQRGVARESDANALAYLVALEAPTPDLRYAGALALQRQALSALGALDADGARDLVRRRLPGVQRDVEAMVARSQDVAGAASRAMQGANHRMLIVQGIREGVTNYQGSLWIVAALSERQGVEALLP